MKTVKFDPNTPRPLRFAQIEQIMSSALNPTGPPAPVLIALTTGGKPYYFHATEQGVAGWVPIYDREAVLKTPSEIEAAAEAVAKAEERKSSAAAEDKPSIITGGEVHRTLGAVREIERMSKS